MRECDAAVPLIADLTDRLSFSPSGTSPPCDAQGAAEDPSPAPDTVPEAAMPRFYYNRSGRFESRFPTVTVSAPRFSAATQALSGAGS